MTPLHYREVEKGLNRPTLSENFGLNTKTIGCACLSCLVSKIPLGIRKVCEKKFPFNSNLLLWGWGGVCGVVIKKNY